VTFGRLTRAGPGYRNTISGTTGCFSTASAWGRHRRCFGDTGRRLGEQQPNNNRRLSQSRNGHCWGDRAPRRRRGGPLRSWRQGRPPRCRRGGRCRIAQVGHKGRPDPLSESAVRCRRRSVDRSLYGRGSAVNTCTGASHTRIHSASPPAASGTLSSFPTTRARPPSALAAKAAQARGDHHPWPCNASSVRNSFGRATARPHSRRSTGAPTPRPTGPTPAQRPSPLTAANHARRGPRLVQPRHQGRPPRPSRRRPASHRYCGRAHHGSMVPPNGIPLLRPLGWSTR